jgi:hypothetical protein
MPSRIASISAPRRRALSVQFQSRDDAETSMIEAVLSFCRSTTTRRRELVSASVVSYRFK